MLSYNCDYLITDYLDYYAKYTSDGIAVYCSRNPVSFDLLNQRVNLYAKALIGSNVQKGDKVALLCSTRCEYWICFLATTSIGAVWLGLNPKYTGPELRYILEDAQPKLLFAIPKFEGYSYAEFIAAVQQDYDFIEQVVSITEVLPNTQSLDAFLAQSKSIDNQALIEAQGAVEPMDPALLVYTSGSTGQPKGALLSHHGLCFGAWVQAQHYGLERPKMLCNFPINHVACVADICCVNLVAGGTLVFQERFDPAQVLAAIHDQQINLILAVPTMLLMLLEHSQFRQTDFSGMAMIAWGGAALPVPIIKQLQKLVPRLMNVYGLTETAANTTYTSMDADIVELSETIGRPSPHMPCRIVNEAGKACTVGEQGELQFKGDYLLLEYLNRPEATRAVYTDDGWLHTGDLGYWREDGTISLVGRISDMFKSGGYNVYPREIENLIESHPSVEIAAVVAVPDSRYQEVGAAFVVLGSNQSAISAEELKLYCRDNLANYKVPKTIRIVSELPVLPVGKVDKVSLKKQAISESS